MKTPFRVAPQHCRPAGSDQWMFGDRHSCSGPPVPDQVVGTLGPRLSVSLRIVQENGILRSISDAGLTDVQATYCGWSEYFTGYVQRVLQRRGVSIDADSPSRHEVMLETLYVNELGTFRAACVLKLRDSRNG